MTSRLRMLDERLFGPGLRAYRTRLSEELSGDWESFLDVGCGEASYVESDVASIPVTVGIDMHLETIRLCQAQGKYSRYECVDVLKTEQHFGSRSFDLIMALDVIEHLRKADGYRMLDALEATAKRRVVILTPNGFLPQGELDGNPFQAHQSGWFPSDFESRGYRVAGVNGWRPLRGERWEPKIRPFWLGYRLCAATERLVASRPHLAFHLLATLDIE